MEKEHRYVFQVPIPYSDVGYGVSELEGWRDLEPLAMFIVQHYGGRILKRFDGMYSRTWNLLASEVEFEVCHHDDVGIFFFTSEKTEKADALMKSIACAIDSDLRENGLYDSVQRQAK